VFSRSPQSYFFKISSPTADSDLVITVSILCITTGQRDFAFSHQQKLKFGIFSYLCKKVHCGIVADKPTVNEPASSPDNEKLVISSSDLVFLPIVRNPEGIN
jgi:hypothetical protein